MKIIEGNKKKNIKRLSKMPKFKITVFELDFLTEEKTGKVLFETTIEAKNKARSVSNALKLIHDNGIYEQYRHLCFTESEEVE